MKPVPAFRAICVLASLAGTAGSQAFETDPLYRIARQTLHAYRFHDAKAFRALLSPALSEQYSDGDLARLLSQCTSHFGDLASLNFAAPRAPDHASFSASSIRGTVNMILEVDAAGKIVFWKLWMDEKECAVAEE